MTLRARDIADICEDLRLERISIAVKEGWDHSPLFHLSFGPPAYRQIMQVDPAWDASKLKAELHNATQPHAAVEAKPKRAKADVQAQRTK